MGDEEPFLELVLVHFSHGIGIVDTVCAEQGHLSYSDWKHRKKIFKS